MPIYEYGCKKCGKTFEFMQSMSEPRKTKCPECKGKLERLISSTAFHLKGGGWYKDLYSSTKPDAGASASSDGDGGGSAAASETKSETKTETKSESKSEGGGKSESKPAKAEKSEKKPAKKKGKD